MDEEEPDCTIKMCGSRNGTHGDGGSVDRTNCKWMPPLENWFEVNVDGAVCEGSGRATGGGVTRGSSGKSSCWF